jgi:hypothetical protein
MDEVRVLRSFPSALNLFQIYFLFYVGPQVNRVQNRDKRRLRLRKVRAKSQSHRNRGKITIRYHSRGMITKFPFSFLRHLM